MHSLGSLADGEWERSERKPGLGGTRRSRPFLIRGETFAAAALAFYITGVSYFTYEELRLYTDLLVDPFRKSFGPSPPVVYVVVGLSIFGVILCPAPDSSP